MVAAFYATIFDYWENIGNIYWSETDFLRAFSSINSDAQVTINSPFNASASFVGGYLNLVYNDQSAFTVRLEGQGQTAYLTGIGHVIVYGSEGSDFIYGNDVGNRISGGDGADYLDGYGGADTLAGGAGDDTFRIDDLGDRVIEARDQGYDTVYASISYSLQGQHVERIELTGAADINATGNYLANTFVGNEGVNILSGGKGDDVYYIQTIGDRVIEGKGEGHDTVHSTISYSLMGQHVEDLTLEGSGDVNATGNYLANTLVGNEGVNILSGGKGDDVYYIQTIGDRVIEGKGEGHDTVYSAISYSVQGQYVEDLFLTGEADIDATGNFLDNFLGGNDGANHLYGGKGNDTLDGGFGAADTLEGGAGNDHYDVRSAGDRVIEGKGDGYDIVYASVDFALTGQYIEELVLVDEAVRGVGNSLANGITGSSLDNILDGWSGMDTLFGGGGADTFVFSTKLGPTNVDTIWDFATGVDKIQLNASVFSGLTAGGLSEEAFHIGLAAHDANDRIIYDSASGALFFDRDGSGDRYGQIQFATLNDHPGLNFSDFQVV